MSSLPHVVKTNVNSSLPHPKATDPNLRRAFFQQISPKKGSLPQLIRRFKGAVTRLARARQWLEADPPLWQARYYDRIVRDRWELERLKQHIQDNPRQWKQDDYHCATPKWQALSSKLQDGLVPAMPLSPTAVVVLDQSTKRIGTAQTVAIKAVRFIEHRFQRRETLKTTWPYQKSEEEVVVTDLLKPPD